MSIIKDIAKKKNKLMNLYISKEEADKLKKYADLYTKGNVSAWIRYASMNYRPRRSELINE